MIHDRLKKINRIIISIGHDPKAQGAQNAKGEKENTLCRTIAQHLANYLNKNGFVVWLIPDYTLAETIQYLNLHFNSFTDFALEIHKDSCGNIYNDENMHRRCGLYFEANSSGARSVADRMIQTMEDEGAHETSWVRPDTDSHHGRLGFCSRTKMLAMIAELGFIEGNNEPDECEWYAWVLTRAILMVLEKPIKYMPINMTTIQPIL